MINIDEFDTDKNREELVTIASVSGGKSSAMMLSLWSHEIDVALFSVVLTQDKNARPKDKGLLRECQKKIPWFEASRELDLTLINLLRLEQELGREIRWLAAEFTYDELIGKLVAYHASLRSGHKFLPNARHRLCTQYLKINPIFEYWHTYCNPQKALMYIGFRYDEPRRLETWTCDKEKYRYPLSCNLKTKKQRWKEFDWRIGYFPLFNARIDTFDVYNYWTKKGWEFPAISNCDFCFHHRDVQQQRQAELYPERVQWWINWEKETGQTFGKRSMEQILSQPLLDVYEDEPCYCTD